MIYVCENCPYQHKEKGKMIQHLNKKRPCSNETVIVNKTIMKLINLEGTEVIKVAREAGINLHEYTDDMIFERGALPP